MSADLACIVVLFMENMTCTQGLTCANVSRSTMDICTAPHTLAVPEARSTIALRLSQLSSPCNGRRDAMSCSLPSRMTQQKLPIMYVLSSTSPVHSKHNVNVRTAFSTRPNSRTAFLESIVDGTLASAQVPIDRSRREVLQAHHRAHQSTTRLEQP